MTDRKIISELATISYLERLPRYTLGYALNSICKILVYFLIPSSVTLIVYLLLILSDFGLVYSHIAGGNPRWGSVTLLIMFTPSIGSFIFIISSPNRWPSENWFNKLNLKFLLLNTWHLFGFPVAASYRYVHQIFWSVEAVCAEWSEHTDRRENALRILLKPNSTELYFFLQAYIHSAPQILLQLFILFQDTNRDIVNLQVMSVVSSLFRMAITTTAYQRFERRKVLGDFYPWTSKRVLSDYDKGPSNKFSFGKNDTQSPVETETLHNIPTDPINSSFEPFSYDSDDDEVFKEQDFPDECVVHSGCNFRNNDFRKAEILLSAPKIYEKCIENEFGDKSRQLSSTSTMFEEPVRNATIPKDSKSSSISTVFEESTQIENTTKRKHSSSDSAIFEETTENEIYRRTVSFAKDSEIDIRRKTRSEDEILKQNIVDMSKHVTPPSTPAPRPISISGIKDMIVSNTTTFIESIPRRRYKDFDELDLPVRVKRKLIKGVEQQDGVAKLIAFVAWFLFIGSRILVLATFSNFYTIQCVYVCMAHYALAVLSLFLNSKLENVNRLRILESTNRKFFYLFLGYIYIFCLLEFKMKFKKVRLWYIGFFFVTFVENFTLTCIWYWNEEATEFWYDYLIVLIFSTCFLSYICFLLYILILKPKPIIIVRNSTYSVSPATF